MTTEIKPNEFQCAKCGGIFEKDWSDEEAKAEMVNLWGDLPEEEQAVICDDCHKAFMKWFDIVFPKKD
jgi:Zn finger protein HypA/HybF involved in hydrogenase expression